MPSKVDNIRVPGKVYVLENEEDCDVYILRCPDHGIRRAIHDAVNEAGNDNELTLYKLSTLLHALEDEENAKHVDPVALKYYERIKRINKPEFWIDVGIYHYDRDLIPNSEECYIDFFEDEEE